MVKTDLVVMEAHKMYLMYRDMAAMSFPLIILAPAALYFMGASTVAALTAAGLFAGQFIVCAICARHSSVRFVSNALAIHSTRKVS